MCTNLASKTYGDVDAIHRVAIRRGHPDLVELSNIDRQYIVLTLYTKLLTDFEQIYLMRDPT